MCKNNVDKVFWDDNVDKVKFKKLYVRKGIIGQHSLIGLHVCFIPNLKTRFFGINRFLYFLS